MKKMKNFGIVLGLLIAVSAGAVEILDQSCYYEEGQDIAGVVFGWQVQQAGHWVPMLAQTITTGSGVTNISKVRVALWDATTWGDNGYDGNGPGVRLMIWKDETRREFLGEAFALDQAIPGWEPADRNTMTDFVFSPPVPVEPETTYFLEITTNQIGPQYNVVVTWPTTFSGDWFYALGSYYVHGWDVISRFYADNPSDANDLTPTLAIHDLPVPEGGEQQIPWGGRAVIGQTFTATTSVLQRVDVAIKDQYSEGLEGVTMHLYKGGAGRENYIASAYVPDSEIAQDSWDYAAFVFDEPVDLIPGHLYFMEFVSNDFYYQLGASTGTADYVSGELWRNDNAWNAGWADSEWIFETYTATAPQFCGDVGIEYAAMDLNKDCRVDLEDFVIFAADWLVCTDPLGCN